MYVDNQAMAHKEVTGYPPPALEVCWAISIGRTTGNATTAKQGQQFHHPYEFYY
jgi:hypothetical protein